MNNFYNQPLILLWVEAVILLVIGFYPAISIIEAGYVQPLFYLLFIVILPLFQFASTPIFKLIGVYTYYSPMLIGYMANHVQIDLHSGSSFDYLFVMRKFKMGNQTRNQTLAYHLEGLLHIIKMIESDKIPNTVNIIGTSYFFNERTIHRLGFELEKPSVFYRINLIVNFIDLTWMYSIAKGKFSIPKVWNARKVKVIGSKLVSKKELIKELHTKITNLVLAKPMKKA